MALIEVCVDNFESVKAAVEGGCRRIELCSSLLDGGLTPSCGFLKHIKDVFPSLVVFPMIRPRGGDFCYSKDELEIMSQDIESLKKFGANGFVFGCLSPDGSINIEANKLLITQAGSLPCTFHRAFDMVKDVKQSLEDVIRLGFTRILTSGQSKTAIDGLKEIKELVIISNRRIIIMPGAGINDSNLEQILKTCQVDEFHCSASALRQSDMIYRNSRISMGTNSSEYSWKVSVKGKIQKLIETANSI